MRKTCILESIFFQNKYWFRIQNFVYNISWLAWISVLISAINKEFCFFLGKGILQKQ